MKTSSLCCSRLGVALILFLTFGLAAQAQLKLFSNGKLALGPTPTNAPTDRLVIDGGPDRGLLVKVSHPNDWWQSTAASVSRQLTVSWVVRYNGGDRFYVLGNGDLIARGAWYYSDSTLKADVKPIPSPVASLQKIRGVTYSYKPEAACKDCEAPPSDDPTVEGVRYGFVAQEVERVFPEMVMENDQNLKLVSYEQMIPVLVEAVKAQQAQIDAMQLEINALKKTRTK